MGAQGNAVERIGILGGTFDPLHIGHLVAASEALHAVELDRVIFIPAGRPWQKSTYAPAEDRFMMTTLGVAAHPHFSVSRVELDRRGPTYTVETLETLTSFFQGSSLFFIAGMDAVADLGTWHRVEELASLAEVIAVTRPGSTFDIAAAPEGWPRVHAMEIPQLDVSSTMVRQRLAKGEPIDFLVPPTVVDYIRQHGLYVGTGAIDA
jgi:nicotinate-nucleotide adenylyltransferase